MIPEGKNLMLIASKVIMQIIIFFYSFFLKCGVIISAATNYTTRLNEHDVSEDLNTNLGWLNCMFMWKEQVLSVTYWTSLNQCSTNFVVT